ncbi:GPI ethanolamine phosphate transferase 1 [Battus philenor]|uniref:GPI ethanolamine phosphate transferase 1 n=1 Tax=Battus philenor TaxID=42288 RepID=UPI0035D0FF0E
MNIISIKMFLFGIIIHITFLFSIFDIYFKSPIVKNVIPHHPLHEPPSNRLVLFVVDGLRAESFLNYSTMPYLRSIANSHGRWGISSTRVPTESRPGHVAIIAGFYEDPSAVIKGWKENPVDFDSVFNRTTYTWCWGTYDIVDIFTKGTIDGHIFVNKFDPYDQSFSADKNTTMLDQWVFQNVQLLFEKAEITAEIKKKLQSDKIVLFLHLLGTDTAGHVHKPKTGNFLTTLKYVDENIEVIEKVIRNFYNDDGKTTFLMTSDHGMTDWGSHGTGDDHETKTPYVLWGAGVQQVRGLNIDAETKTMYLEQRYDINQADLAPLMSTILSIPVPVNSIGKLPIDLLNMTISNKAKAIYINSMQLLSQYNKKRLDIEENALKMFYYSYEPLNPEKIQEISIFADKLLQEHQYEDLILFSEEIMALSLSGLTYYHNYYQWPLLFATTLSFLGWITCLLKILLQQKVYADAEYSDFKKKKTYNLNHKLNYLIKITSAFLGLLIIYLVYVQNLPYLYYIYFLMPVFLWTNAFLSFNLWIHTFQRLRNNRSILQIFTEILCYVIGSFAMGLSFTHRWMLSIPLLSMGIWPCFSSSLFQLPRSLLSFWMFGCMSLSMFSFIPVVGKEVTIELVVIAGLIWILVMTIFSFFNNDNENDTIKTLVQAGIFILSLYIIFIQAKRFESELPLSSFLQTLCWIFSAVIMILPLTYSRKITNRLMGINTSIVNFYLLLSVSHEGLFIVALIFNVTCWMLIEFQLLNLCHVKITDFSFANDNEGVEKSLPITERGLSSHDFRRAFFCVLYIILAFFGTGNIASLNSFEVRWVICFTTSFQPFIITGLVLLKTLAPFLCVGCTFRAVQQITKAPAEYLNIIVLIYTNIMGIQLLYNVKNTGSWLEIGTSISQFVIVQLITLFIVLINQIAKIWTETDIYNLTINMFKNRKKYV